MKLSSDEERQNRTIWDIVKDNIFIEEVISVAVDLTPGLCYRL